MTTKSDNITPAEWQIMEALWRKSPLSAAEIFEAIQHRTDWGKKTIRSFLDRLENKKTVRKDKVHGINVYKPIPDRSKCLRCRSQSFLFRYFQGNVVSLIGHFVEQESLSRQDIVYLQEILAKKENDYVKSGSPK